VVGFRKTKLTVYFFAGNGPRVLPLSSLLKKIEVSAPFFSIGVRMSKGLGITPLKSYLYVNLNP